MPCAAPRTAIRTTYMPDDFHQLALRFTDPIQHD